VRRTVATLLVVASPLLMAAPVGATGSRHTGPAVVPAAPALVPAPPVTVAAPAAPSTPEVPAVTAPAVPVPAHAAAAVRPVVRAVRAKTPTGRDLSDAAYAAQLQADLCRARAIFCGLDRGGRYPTR
jgi:hypothetical protein